MQRSDLVIHKDAKCGRGAQDQEQADGDSESHSKTDTCRHGVIMNAVKILEAKPNLCNDIGDLD